MSHEQIWLDVADSLSLVIFCVGFNLGGRDTEDCRMNISVKEIFVSLSEEFLALCCSFMVI